VLWSALGRRFVWGWKALEKELDAGERPEFWAQLWERYVENKFDFRSAPEVLRSKHRPEWNRRQTSLLEWVEPMRGEVRYAPAGGTAAGGL